MSNHDKHNISAPLFDEKEERARSKKFNDDCGRLIPFCLFLNGESPQSDDERAQLVKFMGQIISGHIGQGVIDYSVPRSAVLQPEFPGALERWDEAVEAGLIEERSNGYIVPQQMIYVLEEATGKKLAQAQALYQQTRPSGERHIG